MVLVRHDDTAQVGCAWAGGARSAHRTDSGGSGMSTCSRRGCRNYRRSGRALLVHDAAALRASVWAGGHDGVARCNSTGAANWFTSHFGQPSGGRATDPSHYVTHVTPCAMRCAHQIG